MPRQLRSDAALLWDLRRLGGQLVRTDLGQFWAIFDREYLEAVGTETRVPVLTARTSDVEACLPRKGGQVTVGSEVFKARRQDPDGTGMSLVYLES